MVVEAISIVHDEFKSSTTKNNLYSQVPTIYVREKK